MAKSGLLVKYGFKIIRSAKRGAPALLSNQACAVIAGIGDIIITFLAPACPGWIFTYMSAGD